MIKRKEDIVIKPRTENQRNAVRSSADFVVLTGNTGGGKANSVNSLVLTVNGWKRMGDVKVGDKLVAPLNNEESIVTNIFPQGIKPVYKLTTSDDRSTTVSLEHLWMVRTEKQKFKAQSGRANSFYVKTTKEIIDEYLSKDKKVYLPLPNAYKGVRQELPIDPYVLGIWIGDGCKMSRNSLLISNDEGDIIKKIGKILETDYVLHKDINYTNRILLNSNSIKVVKYLKEVGLNDYSRNRFIPREYLNASIEQRMELLKGLMDSDGDVGEKNRFTFSTTSEKLKNGFIELCRSLGYIVTANLDKRTRYISGQCYKISIQTNDIIFSSNKHLNKYYYNKEKYQNRNTKKYYKQNILIKSIEYVGEEECQCIMVSNKDHLYITDDYIVTHNTFALYYAPINYLTENPGSKIICFMRNVADFWGAGKVSDTMKQLYPLVDRSVKRQPHDPVGEIIRNQVDMGVKFYNGSEIKFQQLDNESRTVIDKISKGIQTKKLIFDECNKFEWNTITTLMTRLRSDSDGHAQIYLAQNPERKCPLRTLCGNGEHGGGWIAENGEPIKEMDGRVMYFFMHNGKVEETYFGRTKEEVYSKCKGIIDSLTVGNEDMSYEDFILSMVFYTFDVRDNKIMLAKNKRYRGLTANSATAQSSYGNNWNYSIDDVDEEEEQSVLGALRPEHIENMFRIPTEVIRKTEKITVDMAFTGTDNMVLMHWIGFHCDDIAYSEKNSFSEAVNIIMSFMEKHKCDKSQLIIDVQGDTAIKDVFDLYRKAGGIGTDSVGGSYGYAFSGAVSATGKSKVNFERFKDEAAYLAVNMIKCGLVTFDPILKQKRYTHQKLKREGATTICKQMIFESKAFVFDKTPTGRIRFMPKEKQHASLKGFSPDLLDNVIMRCGTAYSVCYEAIARLTGVNKIKFGAKEILNNINFDKKDSYEEENIPQHKITVNSEKILNIFRNL